MGDSRGGRDDIDYESLRGEAVPSIDNLIRWEIIKLCEAARDAVQLLETGVQPTREYLDYMFDSDICMRELRARMAKHRERLEELESMRTYANMALPRPACVSKQF